MKRAWFLILFLAVTPSRAGDRGGVTRGLDEALARVGSGADSARVRDLRFWTKNEGRLREVGAMVGEFPLPKEADPLRPDLIDRCLRSPVEAIRVGLDLADGEAPESLQWLATGAPPRKVTVPRPVSVEYDLEAPAAVLNLWHLLVVFQKAYLETGPEGSFPDEMAAWMRDGIDPEHLKQAREVLDLHSEADFAPVLRQILEGLPGKLGPVETLIVEGPWPKDEPRRIPVEGGFIVFGTMGDDLYEEDAVLLIEPGGNDVYRNNAGGATDGVAMLVDLGGDDRYESKAPFTQGSALHGIGILLDLAGNDRYVGGEFCQGAAVGGVGVLLDLGGTDTYVAESFAQGAGALGFGVLRDEGGQDDSYEIGRLGQGLGRVGGYGVLRDLGGNDRYVVRPQHESMYSQWTGGRKVHWSFAQGCGFGFYCRYNEKRADGKEGLVIREIIPGGVGVIADDAGDDVYEGSMYAQGTAYFYGLGICLDRGGNDRYVSTWYGQGAAPHFAAGILVDAGGNDDYRGMNQVQGNGRDFSTAVFLDLGGDDRYFAEDRAQGCGDLNDSWGIFVDASGDDRYEATESTARGFATNRDPAKQPTEERPYADYGIFLDLGGTDEYVGPAKGADGKSWLQKKTGRGVGIDLPEEK